MLRLLNRTWSCSLFSANAFVLRTSNWVFLDFYQKEIRYQAPLCNRSCVQVQDWSSIQNIFWRDVIFLLTLNRQFMYLVLLANTTALFCTVRAEGNLERGSKRIRFPTSRCLSARGSEDIAIAWETQSSFTWTQYASKTSVLSQSLLEWTDMSVS